MVLSSAIDLFLESRQNVVAPKTLQLNRQALAELARSFADKEIDQITVDDLRAWRDAFFARDTKYANNGIRPPEAGKISPYSVRWLCLTARQFFNWLVNEGHLETSPAKRLELPSMPKNPPKDITDETFMSLLETAQRDPCVTRRLRNVAILWFLHDTGCRIGGLSSLRYESLNMKQRTAVVTEKGKGGGKTRTVYFTENTENALTHWMLVHPAVAIRHAARSQKNVIPVDHIFVSERYPYGPLTSQSLYCVIHALRVKAGVRERANPHSFRHARARTLLKNGAPLGLVSRVLGHNSIEITNKFYGVYTDSEVRLGYEKYA